MSSKFYFNDSSSSTTSSTDNLPYPTPLPRQSFLTPTFSPLTFLSTLHNRHQTLEDLRSELRTRSQDLNKELLDLVNENYQDFLGLGGVLKGGEERVEEVRLGLLGFRREVEGLRGAVEGVGREVAGLVEDRGKVRGEVLVGRGLLEAERRIGELEGRLMVGSTGARKGEEEGEDGEWSESEEESEEDEGGSDVAVTKLGRHVEQYMYIRRLFEKIGEEHPFLVKQEERVLKLKQTVLLDLNSALKQAVAGGNERRGDLLKLLGIYRQMGQVNEALNVLKAVKG
ncbi:hypothetical protein N7G274_006646 [Stereocaulon virgatum]|uniref:Conserved oligomeric Golgi complex subunit 2 n=1 Tax=Stereocaulon virgatum TaxID=373712 RepID=A0ABR4A8G4_9LECA